jgi:hypothetical protein
VLAASMTAMKLSGGLEEKVIAFPPCVILLFFIKN